MRDNGQSEADGAGGDSAPNRTIADEPQSRSVDLEARQIRLVNARPRTQADVPFGCAQAPSGPDGQGDGEVGNSLRKHTGGVRDGDATADGCLDIDRVVSGTGDGDEPQISALTEESVGHGVAVDADDGTAVPNQLDQVVDPWRALTLPEAQHGALRQPRQATAGQIGTGHGYRRLGAHQLFTSPIHRAPRSLGHRARAERRQATLAVRTIGGT